MVEELIHELSSLEQVEAIALGGSRAGSTYDEKSDYDVYIYCTSPIDEKLRRQILSKYCSVMEIGNHYWEYEDNCTLNNGMILSISLDTFSTQNSRFLGNQLSEMEQISMESSGMDICSISGVARSGG